MIKYIINLVIYYNMRIYWMYLLQYLCLIIYGENISLKKSILLKYNLLFNETIIKYNTHKAYKHESREYFTEEQIAKLISKTILIPRNY